jgi:hypothetical protein
MIKMKTLTIGDVTYEVVDAGLRENVVMHKEQDLTEEKQSQARKNIGAVKTWDELEEKPFGEEEVAVNEPLNLTWDGNTDGLIEVASTTNSRKWYKVSDDVFTDEELKTMSVHYRRDNGSFYSSLDDNWDNIKNAGGVTEEFVIDDFADTFTAFIRKPNITIAKGNYNATFPDVGVYFLKYPNAWTTALTSTTAIQHTKTVTKTIDFKYLPVQDIINSVLAALPTWEGGSY